jgi:hypothetical protein
VKGFEFETLLKRAAADAVLAIVVFFFLEDLGEFFGDGRIVGGGPSIPCC